MAPEQGPDSKSKAEKTQRIASDEESAHINDNNQQNTLKSDNIGWIYLLKKEQLVEQCRNTGIPTTGFTVDYLRKRLAEVLRAKRLRPSSENLLRDVEDEVRLLENTVIQDEMVVTPVISTDTRKSTPDADVMSTIQKWNLQFSGNSDLMEFLERIEELAECYQIHNDRLLPAMFEILSGNALKWYRIKRNEIHSWNEFRNEIQKFFLPKRFLSQIEQNFYTRRQNNKERAKDFILSMLTLARQHPELRSRDHLDRIYDGLRPEYRLYVRRSDFSSLDDLISMVDDFEAIKREERPQPTHSIAPAKYRRQEVCWRCKRKGHYRYACTEKRVLFCSYCGRDGVFSSSCECRGAGTDKPVDGDARYYIVVDVNGLKLQALIDTGASRTHINERVARHLSDRGVQFTSSGETAQMADQSIVTLSRRFSVNISLGHRRIPICVYEIPTLAEDIILGMDFLMTSGIEIRLCGKTVPMSESSPDLFLHSLTSRKFATTKKNKQRQTLLEEQKVKVENCSRQRTVTDQKFLPKHNRPKKRTTSSRNSLMPKIIESETDKLLSKRKVEPSRSCYTVPVVRSRKKPKIYTGCQQSNITNEPDSYPKCSWQAFEQPNENRYKRNVYDLWWKVPKRKNDTSVAQEKDYNLRRRPGKPHRIRDP